MDGLELDYAGVRWGYAFISADGCLDEEERESLLISSIKMYLSEEEQRDVIEHRFEGRIYNTKKHCLIGAFSGRVFKAELDVDNFGKTNLSFLVTEYINPEWN